MTIPLELEVERASIGDLQTALGKIGLNLKQIGNHWEVETQGWKLEANQVTQAALVMDVKRLGEPEGTRRLMRLLSPAMKVDPDSGSLTLSNIGDNPQEVVLYTAGGVVFRPEFNPKK